MEIRPLTNNRLPGACCWLLCLLLAACAPEQSDHLLQAVAGLPPEVATHLATDTDAEFAVYGRESGNLILRDVTSLLMNFRRDALDLGLQEYVRRDSLIAPYCLRLARCLDQEYGLHDYLHMAKAWQALSPDQKIDVERLYQRAKSAHTDQTQPLAAREEILRDLLRQAPDFQPYLTVANLADFLADLSIAAGRKDEHRYYLDLAIDHARRDQKYVILSQLLGELGTVHKWAGMPDSMWVCYDEALAVAMQHRLPEMAGRIHEFNANFFYQQGRLGLAKNSFDRAIEICREFKGSYWELRFLLEVMEFHADQGCWDLVEQHLQRAAILKRQFSQCPVPHWAEAIYRHVDRLQARWLLATGRISAGESLYAELDARDWSTQNRSKRVRLLKSWGEDLLRNDRFATAISVLEDGIRLCRAENMPEEEPRLWVLLAKAHLADGDRVSCEKAQENFRDLAHSRDSSQRPEWLLHDLLTIEVCQSAGNPADTAAAVELALRRLREFLTSLDFSSESYLVLGQADKLHRQLQGIVRPNPEISYAVEMLWRQAVADLGSIRTGGPHPLESCADLLRSYLLTGGHQAELPVLVQQHLDLLKTLSAVHICYLTDTTEITRWVADGRRIQCQILDRSAQDVTTLVDRARDQISADPGSVAGQFAAGLQDQLEELGEVLLPSLQIRGPNKTSGERPLLLITAEGCLVNFPFATLALPGGAYHPVLADYDLAYLPAPLGLPQAAAMGPGLIVADPILSPEIARWVGSVTELDFGLKEAFFLHELVPSAQVLSREGATKAALLEYWSTAPFLYFAAHVMRDPEDPYLSFLPLSVDRPGLPLDAAILDAADIRAARFDGCALVVLSGCSSGKTFQGGRVAVPALGAAFSTAGADCVVQTFWDVRDEDADRLMEPFLRAWASDHVDPVRALAHAQRQFLYAESDAFRNPFTWGAYSVLVRRMPPARP